MVKVLQELYFSKSAKAKHGMVKGHDTFDGYCLSSGFVMSRAAIWREGVLTL
jgi:hypothetical protein